MMKWKCKKCEKLVEPQIQWGMSGSEKVDIIDYFCPECGSIKLEFQGTVEERIKWWKRIWEEE